MVFLSINPILRCKSNPISTKRDSFVVLIMENIPRVLGGLAETWTKPNVCVCVCVCVCLHTRACTHTGTQLCPTLCDPMDCSPSGSSVHGDSLSMNTGLGCRSLLQGIFPNQGSTPGLLHCRWILCHLR